ncbi:hypothetical protein [Vallitalea guaymasensis]|uniref:hypothetical protein n=1 Tax=Vallitalea guaymasensis TaxID=1185412 RepID=UPI000DE510C6|nr:hypothetical protein [Vallitalea guaymasensis]
MNFAMVINVYIDTDKNMINVFDHPTGLESFEDDNTLVNTIKSVNELKVYDEDNLKIYIFAIGTNEDTTKDSIIRDKVAGVMNTCRFPNSIYTNTDINSYRINTQNEFFSVKGYPEIRTLGFIIPYLLDEDIIIQIDDDELLRKDYMVYIKEVLNDNEDKYIFTAPYEKNGTIKIKTEDKLKSWKKFSSMDNDIIRLTKDDNIKETLFGFGGNMIVRKDFAGKMFYPEDVPRGEDFSLLLASRLIYANGNEKADIHKEDKMFKAYFLTDEAVTIIHEPPVEAKADFLFYLEKNLKRFIMEWNMFTNQKAINREELKDLSDYMSEMIGYDDMAKKVNEIINEVNDLNEFNLEDVEKLRSILLDYINHYKELDRFTLFKARQHHYINSINDLKKNKEFVNKLLNN